MQRIRTAPSNLSPSMILPEAYRREIQALEQQFAASNPTDIVQFCADFFTARLAAERASVRSLSARNSPRSGTPDKLSESFDSFASFKMNNSSTFSDPFASANSNINSHLDVSNSFQPSSYASSDNAMHSIEEEEDDIGIPIPTPTSRGFSGFRNSPFGSFEPESNIGLASGPPPQFNLNRRVSVSAESLKPTADNDEWQPPYNSKTPDQLARLKASMNGNFLFSSLDDEQTNQVLGAMVEKPIPAKDIKVITQGDTGDFFYIVEKGKFAVYVNSTGTVQPGPDGMGVRVAEIGSGGSFGELALMYNAPRAATVVSTDPGSTLWALDRVTFRRILLNSTFNKRRMYEAFLGEVPLLAPLTPYERSKIADALEQAKYSAGETIINEGETGDHFFIVESGEANAIKDNSIVKHYIKGDFFGELALLNDAPRAATVVAATDVKVVSLGKSAFQRLLGPVEGIMRRTQYVGIESGVEEMDPLEKH